MSEHSATCHGGGITRQRRDRESTPRFLFSLPLVPGSHPLLLHQAEFATRLVSYNT
jgi:hypothetical protein